MSVLTAPREDFITTLQSLAQNVHLLVTARPLPSIDQQFQGVNRLEILENIDDVRKYIQDRIHREWRLARLVKNDWDLQESIANGVVAKASGMYV